jgi:hypothetical protein
MEEERRLGDGEWSKWIEGATEEALEGEIGKMTMKSRDGKGREERE